MKIWVFGLVVAIAISAFLILSFVSRPPPLTGPGGFRVPSGFEPEEEKLVENYIFVKYVGSGNLGKALDSFDKALRKENWQPIGEGSILWFYGRLFEKDDHIALIFGDVENEHVYISVIVGPKPLEEAPRQENEQPQENEQLLIIRSLSFTMLIENYTLRKVEFYVRNLDLPDNLELRINAINENNTQISYIMSWKARAGWVRSENEDWITFENANVNFYEFWNYYSVFLNFAGAFARIYTGQDITYKIGDINVVFTNILTNPVLPDILFQPI